jgi:hypothetical protein
MDFKTNKNICIFKILYLLLEMCNVKNDMAKNKKSRFKRQHSTIRH